MSYSVPSVYLVSDSVNQGITLRKISRYYRDSHYLSLSRFLLLIVEWKIAALLALAKFEKGANI